MPGNGVVQKSPPEVVLPMAEDPPPMQVPPGAAAGQSSCVSAGTLLTGVQLIPLFADSVQLAPPPTTVQPDPAHPTASGLLEMVETRRHVFDVSDEVASTCPVGGGAAIRPT